jgi:peptidoglycan/xylan/chitin deacetylase (PgdA/CDA1 family)
MEANHAMQFWKRQCLGAYYRASLPYRRWWMRRAAAAGKAPVMVLFYHRVADEPSGPCTISRTEFTQQMDWLADQFDLVSLEEAQRRIRHGSTRPAVSITFDDGYAENCEHALPLLIKRQIPCTYFVCTRHVVRGLPFPHDMARNQPHQPNTIEQLRALASAGVEIGAHTRTHADLGRIHDNKRLRDEVVYAGQELAAAVGCPVRYFAFPFGQHENLNIEAFRMTREAGYEAVCSAYGGFNLPGDDPFHLQRIHGDPEMLRLKNWLTVDPRKLAGVERFRYQTEPARRGNRVAVGAMIL